ncbi:alpha/beta hydrolase [Endozoicomonas sp. 4G]|uniref:alpha/beta fold hydrolase n=1 Tax=Endozoicomonas sp. 4G TaxID=2872754 RepID=UPI00207868F1|nr:alpha/beta hydrolase [Endozoicomonas sp. 4G]
MTAIEIPTSTYTLKAWMPRQSRTEKLRVYIEGDGKAWLKRGTPSSDPTPINRLVHSLMLADPYPDIAYLGRPCQYIMTRICNKSVWTFGRYDSASLESTSEALDYLKKKGGYKKLELVGYSGGATLALLSASQRDDVTSIWTVAGNLDPLFTNQFHKVSPMPSALNPLDFQDQLNGIPQLHFYGSEDLIIPEQVSKHYQTSLSSRECTSIVRVEGATHSTGWSNKWKQLIGINPACDFNEKGDGK